MQLLVTGASTPLGQGLLRALAARGALTRDGAAAPIARILGVDREQPPGLFVDERVEYVCGEYEQPRFLVRVMGAATDSVFHLSALEAVRGAPDDPDGLDRALLRSFDSTRALLDACRHQLRRPRLVYAGLRGLRSGGAVAPDTEGTCIDLCESLLAEAARRKLIELRSLRLATRPAPGSPPAALEAAAQALVGAHERNTPLEMALIIEDGNA